MDPRSNVALKAIALRTDIEEIAQEADKNIDAGERPGGVCPCRLALARLSHVKPQLAALRRRAGGEIPADLDDASRALGRAEKRVVYSCRRGVSATPRSAPEKEVAV